MDTSCTMTLQTPPVPNEDSALRHWRKAKGLTLVQAGQLVQTGHSVWLRWETRARLPGGRSLQRLVRVTGLSSDTILGLTPHDGGQAEPSPNDAAAPHQSDRLAQSDPNGVSLSEEGAASASSDPFAATGDRAD